MRLGRRTVAVGVAVAVLLLVGAGVVVWIRQSSQPFEEAVDRLPAGVLRVGYTDWDAVQRSVPGSDLTASSSAEDMQTFLDRAFDKDLTTASAVSDSFPALAENFGITPLDAAWEVYGQGKDGAVDVLQLSDDVDLEALEERFAELGYDAPPGGPGSDGVWTGTPELVAGLDVPLTPLQQSVAVVTAERLLLMADRPSYLETTMAVIEGEEDSLASTDGVPELVAAAGPTTVAMLWADDFACADLAMSQADPTDAADGEALVEDAGGVHPLEGLVMAQQGDGSLTVGMVFADDRQATDDLQPRTDLASGPAPGQGGTFAERFRVTDSVAEDRVVTMTLEPAQDTVLGDLAQGPVLFATC